MTLSDIKDRGYFRIVAVRATGEIRRRLIDMGFIKGAEGQVLREALLKDPIELRLKGYRISLRRAEAAMIQVEEVNERHH
ncbi:hypothetical protein GF337_04175 [candidate division KSB1 bacterium]|nr:hypothetical protein [candidate division KSB1 bacterium]